MHSETQRRKSISGQSQGKQKLGIQLQLGIKLGDGEQCVQYRGPRGPVLCARAVHHSVVFLLADRLMFMTASGISSGQAIGGRKEPHSWGTS